MANQEEEIVYTTNAEDQNAVRELKQRLQSQNKEAQSSSIPNLETWTPVPKATLDEGAHKYVLISAKPKHGSDDTHHVISKRGAQYHMNAAEVLIQRLEDGGYTNIIVLGGGRIMLDNENKKISIFGFSYGFGRADHSISKNAIESNETYEDYEVTWSNDGY